MAMRWHVAFTLSYRDIEELINEREVKVAHATFQRWVDEAHIVFGRGSIAVKQRFFAVPLAKLVKR